MPVQYTNSKRRTYYLHVGKTKKGNPRYYFAMKSTGNLVDSIPEGYEIYEGPNAHVVLRRIPPKVIFDEEKALVEAGMKKYTDLKYYKIVIKKNTIQVFTPVQDVEMLMEIIEKSKHPILLQALHYSPIMQFVLVDKEKRLFLTKRYYAISGRLQLQADLIPGTLELVDLFELIQPVRIVRQQQTKPGHVLR